MKSVSVKELRGDLPRILEEVEKGEEYVIIYHSRPVGEIVPLRRVKKEKRQKGLYDLLKQDYGEVRLSEGETAVDLIRSDRE